MLLSLSWIQEYVDLAGLTSEEIVKRLALSTAEIEAAHWVGRHFEQVKAARIEKIENHPNSDKLHLATIFDGKERATVVCGAPNIAEGQVVPYASLGTVLPGDFEIKPAKIRGVESRGMLCSVKELGLGEDHSGILQLDKKMEPGTPLSTIYGAADFVIEIENKTVNHRPDLWGHYGYARELRTIFNRPWKKKLDFTGITLDKKEDTLAIEFTTDKALHYIGVKMSGVKVGPSPRWLVERLEAVGSRSINNIVDITNFVMLETGHPLHAFDRKNIVGSTIIVRNAAAGEKFTTLDGIERILTDRDIVIADKEKAVALGGVMGGLHSEVEPGTTELIIESALFDPATIRRTANRLDLRTDAAQRFEKAQWVENSWLAVQRCIELIKELVPGAQVTSEAAHRDASQNYGFKGTIRLSADRIRAMLGVRRDDLPDARIESILTLLEFGVTRTGDEMVLAVPPHRRSKDVSLAADIVEEIGRIYGYDNIMPRPPLFPMLPPPRNRALEKEEKIRDLLVREYTGYEILTYSFLNETEKNAFPAPDETLVMVQGAKESPWLRYTMVPGMLRGLAVNHRQFESFTLFEFGRVFRRGGESRRLAVLVRGESDIFRAVKRTCESLMREFGVPQFRFERPSPDNPFFAAETLHPGRGALLTAMKKKVGILGELHPALLAQWDIKGRAGYIEIDMDLLCDLPEKNEKYKPLPKFPATFFELTVLAPERTEAEALQKVVERTVSRDILSGCEFVSSYKGQGVPEGQVSLSLRVTLAAADRTLTTDEMKGSQEALLAAFEKNGWKLKGA